MPEGIEITRLRQAIEQFKARRPRDLPAGVMDGLETVEKQLGRMTPARDTPGSRAARDAAGTGVPMEKAAKGADQPSPGQKEAMEAARTLVAAVQGGREGQ